MTLSIGTEAPDFTAQATWGEIRFPERLGVVHDVPHRALHRGKIGSVTAIPRPQGRV